MAEHDKDDAGACRLAELRSYQVLDTEPEAAFDQLVQAAAYVAGVPMALVSLIDDDRQWFKARIGIGATETPRTIAFCNHVVRAGAELVVADATVDQRFSENPLVVGEPHIAFYAGFPLRTPSGAVLGTLCVLNREPGTLTGQQLFLLRTLADQVMTQLNLRKEALDREVLIEQLANSEAQYRSLVEHSPDIIARLHPDGVIDYASPALRAVLGADPVMATGSDLLIQAMHPEELPQFVQALDTAGRGVPASFSGRVHHAAGDWRHLEFTLLPMGPPGRDGARQLSCTARDLTDRVAAESALSLAHTEIRERSQQLEEAQRIAEIGSFSYDIRTGQIAWSLELMRIFGVDPDTFTPNFETYLSLIHPGDRDRLLACLAAAQQDGTGYEIEHRLIRPDGVERVLLGRGRVEKDLSGEAIQISGTGQDVTSARQTEQALRAARDLFAQVLANTEQSIIVTDRQGLIIVFNRGAERVLGYTAAELLGQSPAVFHDPAEILTRAAELDVEPGFEVFVKDAAAEPPQAREWTYIAKNGVRRQVQLTVTSMHDSSGELTGYIGVATDITTQRQVERDRDAHALMLRAVIENNQSLIYVRDLEGRYLMVNKAFQSSLGLAEADLIGQTDELHNPDLAPIWRAHDLQALNGTQQIDEYNDLPDGRHWYESVKVPLRDSEGRTYAICGISLDVTASRLASGAMAAATKAAVEANAAKSAFLTTMSHEIRTPMNAVIGMTDLLLFTELNSRQQEYAETIRTSGDALLSVINNILDYSRYEAGDIELEELPFDLRQCVEESLAIVAVTAAGLDLIADIDPRCPRFLVGDAGKIRQILVNLVGNAVKFTEHGDVLVTVTTQSTHPSRLDGNALHRTVMSPDPVELAISVRDTGIGIPQDRMDRLFRSFSQVDASTTRLYGGTGLGLAISRALVQSMGDDITVISEVGVGSTFSFTLTLNHVPADWQPPMETPEVSLRGRTALIVDDNLTNRRVLAAQLAQVGMDFVESPGGLEALAVLETERRIDIAILDFNMPGMNGRELAERIQQSPSRHDLPLILLSSLEVSHHDTGELFSGHHSKPMRAQALQRLIAEVLGDDPVPQVTSAKGSLAPRSMTRLRVLVAEDNLVNQRVTQGMLGNQGHLVEVADDGREALQALERHDYDVVLMDVHMPNMDGLAATRAIRTQIPSARQPHIIAMTASSLPEDRRACIDAGMDSYLLKPVRTADLAHALHTILPATCSSPAVPGPGAAVDLTALTTVVADMGDPTSSAQVEIVDIYLEQSSGWISELTAAARTGDLAEVQRTAHALGSGSAMIGAQRLADLLTDLGPVASAGRTDLTSASITIATEYDRVASELRSHRATLIGAATSATNR